MLFKAPTPTPKSQVKGILKNSLYHSNQGAYPDGVYFLPFFPSPPPPIYQGMHADHRAALASSPVGLPLCFSFQLCQCFGPGKCVLTMGGIGTPDSFFFLMIFHSFSQLLLFTIVLSTSLFLWSVSRLTERY